MWRRQRSPGRCGSNHAAEKPVQRFGAKRRRLRTRTIPAVTAQVQSARRCGRSAGADARDYWNNLIPKAQKHIEDNLAAAEAESSANAAYQSAVKNYSRAVATQNTATLRDDVLPSFSQIAQSGGLRAQEAQQYVDVLIPAALKESGR